MIISRAAIMYANGEVVEGHAYGVIAAIASKLSFTGDRIYGFVTSSGDFVLPAEAADIAVAAGQVTSVKGDLTPEDLWPQWGDE